MDEKSGFEYRDCWFQSWGSFHRLHGQGLRHREEKALGPQNSRAPRSLRSRAQGGH